ncbi:diguanylate cyclase (GGDEF)-like protein [Actinoplanes tereljensis]|uniref:GGDEF domain-containing protein n=1 Tax=Paractinoplanes tereljensis TaxID=571912 RepID=A0A919NWR3_9ACTN|nr:GGDEF domain-containing protein [Actinoplanes tereljensis]GIF25361.1 hypothetical protein Ate02nite_80910 [Actinoplanes tereljensis]
MTQFWRWGAFLMYGSLAVVVGTLLAGPPTDGAVPPWQLLVAMPVFELIGIGMAVRAWRHPGLDRRSRRAWGVIAISLLLRGAAGSVRRPAILITVAMVMLVAGDAYLGYRQSHFGDVPPDRWQYACWITGHFLLAMAAFAQVREAGGHRLRIEDPTARAAARLPYAAMGVGYALMLVAVRDYPLRPVGLVLGAVAMTGVVVARQIIALRENHELATTDTLTGLVNRRQLYERLRLAVARARGRGNVAAVLIDMNEFKQVNDTMGHEAGDQLLVAFGRILRASVFGTDVVGRLGGDEFAIVLHDIDSVDQAVAVVNRIMAAMREPVLIGEVAVQPQASFGIALALAGEDDADALLHRADLAMYQAKQKRTTGYAVEKV